MKVVSISTDTKIFEEGSSVRKRIQEYGTLFDELHVVVFSLKKDGFKQEKLSDNVWVYPTQSVHKLTHVLGAQKITRGIVPAKQNDDWVVTTQDPLETGLVGASLKKKRGIRLNVQVHTDIYSPYFKEVSFLNKIRTRIAPRVLAKTDSVRVVSERIKRSLVGRGISEQNITVLPIFVEQNSFDSFQDVPQKDNTVLVVSRLTKEKNLLFLIDVIEKVIERGGNPHLFIVGDGPLRSQLEAYIVDKNLQNHIELVGWKQDMERWYRKASALIHTSLFEGYGMVFVEAALHHVPVVSSDVGIMGDVLKNEHSACVCSINDVDCFAESLEKLLQDRSFAQKISDNAYKATQKHLPQDKERYLELYKKTL